MYWYYDFISPFAYLQSVKLGEFASQEKVECVPVLFAGLLKHWENIGPAEIAPKRTWTFQHVVWLAHHNNIELKLPEHHPFNPLPLLRLSIALENKLDIVQRLFRFVWVEGKLPQDEAAFSQLLDELRIDANTLNSESIKQQLRSNGEQAVEIGVFGVPTIVRNNQLFWGFDATDMAHAHRDAQQFPDRWPAEEIASIEIYPQGPGRHRP